MNDQNDGKCDSHLSLACLYRRVSTNQQDGSLETQEKRVNDYMPFKRLYATDQTTFFDSDTSGSIAILERPGGAKLFATLKHCPDIKHVVVAKLDRLGRNACDLLETVKKLDLMGVTLHIVDMGADNLSSQGPVGRLLLQILACMAEFERELIRGRIQDALDRRFDQKRIIGTVPYGYNLDPDGNLIDNAMEQSVIRRIAQMRNVLKISYARIAVALNADGVPTKTPKGTRIKTRNAVNGQPEQWTVTSGLWQAGNVEGVLTSNHSVRLLAEEPATDQAQAA